MKKQSYTQIMQNLKLPLDTPETLTCKMCGNPLQKITINPFVCFWIHKEEAHRTECAEKNVLFHKPVVATSHNWTASRTIELWHSIGLVKKQ